VVMPPRLGGLLRTRSAARHFALSQRSFERSRMPAVTPCLAQCSTATCDSPRTFGLRRLGVIAGFLT
jgi:hypothetical protein